MNALLADAFHALAELEQGTCSTKEHETDCYASIRRALRIMLDEVEVEAVRPRHDPYGSHPAAPPRDRNASEKTRQEAIVGWLQTMGAWVIVTQPPGVPMGTPDIIACMPGGRFAGYEVKRPGGKVTPLQKHNLQRISEAGGIAKVVRWFDDLYR